MYDKEMINEWAQNTEVDEFEPLGEVKLLMLICFLIKEKFQLNNKNNPTAKEFYNALRSDRKFASKQYVIYKKIIDQLFPYRIYADELKVQLGINNPIKNEKPKTRKTANKKKAKTKKEKEIKSNVLNFSDFKNRKAAS